jgi:hypothetical protein
MAYPAFTPNMVDTQPSVESRRNAPAAVLSLMKTLPTLSTARPVGVSRRAVSAGPSTEAAAAAAVLIIVETCQVATVKARSCGFVRVRMYSTVCDGLNATSMGLFKVAVLYIPFVEPAIPDPMEI